MDKSNGRVWRRVLCFVSGVWLCKRGLEGGFLARSALRSLGIFAGISSLIVVLLGVGAVVYVANHVRVTHADKASGQDVSIETPGGTFSIRARQDLDPEALGFPIYPNAKRTQEGRGATFEWTSNDGKDSKAMAAAGANYVTHDSLNDVVAWYRERLPGWLVVFENHDHGMRLESTESGFKRIVAVREKGDGTHIDVATVGKPASN